MIAKMDAWIEWMKACLESKEPTLVEMANVAVHPEITNEEGEVETVGKLQD
jgi:N-acetylglutamate synthase-like GNAT family acetyltransferase